MTEPTMVERAKMILGTVASIVTWVVAILVKIVRGILPGNSDNQSVAAQDKNSADT